METTVELADFLARLEFGSLPESAVDSTKMALIDWFGSVLAGSFEEPARFGRLGGRGFGRSDESTLFGGGRAPALAAAFANGISSHILELDDIHKGSTIHGAAPIIPAALAVAERERVDGQVMILAIAAGYDAAFRIGEAVNPSHYRFWHPTGTAATFGAAVSAGILLGLNGEQMRDAIGSAGTQAAGLWEFNRDGSMSKHLHPGKAAMNGILSADLAQAGFTGAGTILEGERGFVSAMSEGGDASAISRGLGETWKIEENGYKLHACCGHTHTAIDSVLELRREFGWSLTDAAREIEAIHVSLYGPGYAIVHESRPKKPYAAKFSIAYCVAVALAEGVVGLDQFTSDRFDAAGVVDPAIVELLQRTTVDVDERLTSRYPTEWPSTLAVTLRDGRTFHRERGFPRGHPEVPVSRATIDAKAMSLIKPRYSEAFARSVVEFVDNVLNVKDMSTAMRNLMSLVPN